MKGYRDISDVWNSMSDEQFEAIARELGFEYLVDLDDALIDVENQLETDYLVEDGFRNAILNDKEVDLGLFISILHLIELITEAREGADFG